MRLDDHNRIVDAVNSREHFISCIEVFAEHVPCVLLCRANGEAVVCAGTDVVDDDSSECHDVDVLVADESIVTSLRHQGQENNRRYSKLFLAVDIVVGIV